jgi:alternate signal-mediated exported protein
MSLRTPLVAAVVGALLVGGAATGTTLALWSDSAPMASSGVAAGTIAKTADGAKDAAYVGVTGLALNDGAIPGGAYSFATTLANASTGKNMRLQMFVDDVSSANPLLNQGLEVGLAAVPTASDCPTAAPGFSPLNAQNSLTVTPDGIPNGERRAVCVWVRVKGGSDPNIIGGASGQLKFDFRGVQLR